MFTYLHISIHTFYPHFIFSHHPTRLLLATLDQFYRKIPYPTDLLYLYSKDIPECYLKVLNKYALYICFYITTCLHICIITGLHYIIKTVLFVCRLLLICYIFFTGSYGERYGPIFTSHEFDYSYLHISRFS